MKSLILCSIVILTVLLVKVANACGHCKCDRNGHDCGLCGPMIVPSDSCQSKLDFVQLGFLSGVVEQFKFTLALVVDDLVDRLQHSYDEFVSAMYFLNNSFTSRLDVARNILLSRIQQRINESQSDQNRTNCLNYALSYTYNVFHAQFSSMINNCSSSFNLDLNPVLLALSNLNASATTAWDGICHCVSEVCICSTEEEKASAKFCAEASASSLNLKCAQNQANVIFEQLQAILNTFYSNVQSCLLGLPSIEETRDNILSQIDSCPSSIWFFT